MTNLDLLHIANQHEANCTGKVNRTEIFLNRKFRGDKSSVQAILVGFRADLEVAKIATEEAVFNVYGSSGRPVFPLNV